MEGVGLADPRRHPDEYTAIARRLAQDLNPGLDWFDPTTFQPERLMYHPSKTLDGDYRSEVSAGKPDLDPDEWLNRYTDWTDATTWPGVDPAEIIHQQRPAGRPKTHARSPASAFNRTYDIHTAISTFLSGEYKKGTTKTATPTCTAPQPTVSLSTTAGCTLTRSMRPTQRRGRWSMRSTSSVSTGSDTSTRKRARPPRSTNAPPMRR